MLAVYRRLGLATAAAILTLPLLVPDASAALRCGNRHEMASALETRFNETRRVMGVINPRMVMEIFTSPKGTWTVLVTEIGGKACITATGEAWQQTPVPVAGLDS
jgi:hypothetical protein